MYSVTTIFIWCVVGSLGYCYANPRVAIIGGGVGGTTAAYQLSVWALKYDINVDLDLYEPGNIGGRLATEFVNGFEFETGGSIIHKENRYMLHFANKFNITKRFMEHEEMAQESSIENYVSSSGFYDGEEFVFLQSQYTVINIMKLWWRYGWDIFNLYRDLVTPFLKDFKKIYQLQEREETFVDINTFLGALNPNFPPLLRTTLKSLLYKNNYSMLTVEEFVFIATNVNYNQNINLHAFAGAVALAGSMEPDALWSVRGGNKRIPEALLAHSDATLIKKKVDSVFLMPNSKFALIVDGQSHVYDYVIVACPIILNLSDRLKFEGFPKPIELAVAYQTTVVTLVHGQLNHSYFSVDSPSNLPNHIFSVKKSLFFNSITVLDPVRPNKSYDYSVFKVFSKKVLTEEQLDSLFLIRNVTKVKKWLAYPFYSTKDKNFPFVLHNNLFFVNAVEWVASAMEMSALSGTNAALHVLKKLRENHHVLEQMGIPEELAKDNHMN